jgi:hypothetical protein
MVGGIIFGLAIAPLAIGSGFPTTVSMAIAFLILLVKYKHDFIWKLNQYRSLRPQSTSSVQSSGHSKPIQKSDYF